MKWIRNLKAFIERDTSKENETSYFVVILRWSICLMLLYYAVYIGVCCIWGNYTDALAAVIGIIMMAVGFSLSYLYSEQGIFHIYMIIMVIWSILSVLNYGWGVGGQHFLLTILIMVFFYVHYNTKKKIWIMLLILGTRMLLFLYSQNFEPQVHLVYFSSFILQVLNSVTLFLEFTISCIGFSSNIQAAEKNLMQANQDLRELASTDPLTNLPNRRYMQALLETWQSNNPKANFTVAIGDIDFFKKVNDTWGHDCGDQVLKALAGLFLEKVKKKGYVGRWGGEEFFFFYPEMNLDETKDAITALSIAVREMQMQYGKDSFQITMTFGLEENDFTSGYLELCQRADAKLYYGKEHGRDCVIW